MNEERNELNSPSGSSSELAEVAQERDEWKSIANRFFKERNEARQFAEECHELVDWNEGFFDIPWKNK